MNNYSLSWVLRLTIIAIGATIGYLIGAMHHHGIIAEYFAYCEAVMP